MCPGCGALTQSAAPELAGYYTTTRGNVRKYMKPNTGQSSPENEVFAAALATASAEVKAKLGIGNDVTSKFSLLGFIDNYAKVSRV